MLDKFYRTVILTLAACCLITCGRAADFTASLDRDAITLGEQATLSLKFDGVQPQNAPTMPAVCRPAISICRAVEFIQLHQRPDQLQRHLQLHRGSATRRRIHHSRDAGEYERPAVCFLAAQIDRVEGQRAVRRRRQFRQRSRVPEIYFPKNKIYVGEPAVARLELYLRDDVQNFGNFQLTGAPTDGFSAGKTPMQNQRRRVQVGNRVYTVIPLAVPLTAIRTGTSRSGRSPRAWLSCCRRKIRAAIRSSGSFSIKANKSRSRWRPNRSNVESLPLPEQNKPANFTGAVGNFTMTATAGPTNVTVGDPITVRVQISGSGALDSLTLPAQDAWRDFKTYPPTTKLETSDQFGFQGTKTFEQIISPQNSDVHELPALSFSFFNPDDGQYHTLTQAAVPLVVKAAGATPMPTLAATKNSTPENQTPQDILPIKENLGTLPRMPPLVSQPVFLAAQSVPVLAFLAAFVWRKRADNLANNPRLRRQLAVAAARRQRHG